MSLFEDTSMDKLFQLTEEQSAEVKCIAEELKEEIRKTFTNNTMMVIVLPKMYKNNLSYKFILMKDLIKANYNVQSQDDGSFTILRNDEYLLNLHRKNQRRRLKREVLKYGKPSLKIEIEKTSSFESNFPFSNLVINK